MNFLNNPRFNKGTAFTAAERNNFGLTGRLPFKINTLDEQCERAYMQLQGRDSAIRKNSFLQSLKSQNLVLYYTLLTRHLRELIPIIYTPTEAEAISDYSHLFRRSEGLYLTFPNQDSMEEDFLEQTKGKNIDLIVCSDSEAILGIGDQGVGGIGISSAKSVIYSLIGGIDPSQALSVVLDVGTDNKDLLEDHLYVGWPHARVRGEEYDKFVDKFVQLVRKHFPQSLLHFEDFGVTNAQRLLKRYRDSHTVFNDDIQGTGAVTLACVMAAVGVTKSKLSEQRYIIYGAGSAGLGITRQLRDAAISIDSISVEKANTMFYLIDKHGLIKQSLGSANIREDLNEFARPDDEWVGVKENGAGEIGLLETVKEVKPTVLIGCSTHAGGFTEEIVKAMAEGCERPIILPLSNPSRLVEVDPKDANDWTHGKALLATGSPFPPAKMDNGKDYVIAECNNALIYPGLGFGAIITKSRRMTDTMLIAGAQRLASLSPALKDPDDALLPDFADAPNVNFEVAVAVAEQAFEEGSADVHWSSKDEARERVRKHLWRPLYGEYVYDKDGMV
ncbi:Malic enzyme [Mycena sanguinolenta]|uniref:Malic enzyme n=1 Tax=Mycena sanguinolenta TaxID=230812 RepID=A0A8H6XBF7_9AGAR|nr:Malic enzyme [Mycena sanguinolenta]